MSDNLKFKHVLEQYFKTQYESVQSVLVSDIFKYCFPPNPHNSPSFREKKKLNKGASYSGEYFFCSVSTYLGTSNCTTFSPNFFEHSKIHSPSDSQTSDQLVAEGLALSNGTQTTGGHFLGIQLKHINTCCCIY